MTAPTVSHPERDAVISAVVVPGRRRAVRTVLVVAATALGRVAMLAGSASASTPDHVKRSVGPIVSDAPAGAVCGFPLPRRRHLHRFYDGSGNLVRVENQVVLSVLHRNSMTGKTLLEEVHEVAHVDLVTGLVRQTGQTWHLRDESGRLVLSGAGLIEIDLLTGNVVKATPHSQAEVRTTVCPLLGATAA